MYNIPKVQLNYANYAAQPDVQYYTGIDMPVFAVATDFEVLMADVTSKIIELNKMKNLNLDLANLSDIFRRHVRKSN